MPIFKRIYNILSRILKKDLSVTYLTIIRYNFEHLNNLVAFGNVLYSFFLVHSTPLYRREGETWANLVPLLLSLFVDIIQSGHVSKDYADLGPYPLFLKMSDDEIDPDLEERLYAQIHHQEDESYTEEPLESHPELRLSIDVDPIKRRFLANRYFVENPAPRPAYKPPPPGGSNYRGPPSRRITTASVLGIAGKMSEGQSSGGSANKPVEATGFKAYTSVLLSMSAPEASNKNFRKPHNVSKRGGQQLENRPDHQLSKLERVQKYLAKAQRVELAKKKTKKQQQQQQANPLTTISLDSSSSSEDDDVIEIPVPPPPLVCLDDSSDDSMQAPPPQVAKVTNPARASRNSSPSSSIVSDDFILPLDRNNCLSDSMDSVNMTEEDHRAVKAKSSVAKTLDKKKESGRSKKQSQQSAASSAAPPPVAATTPISVQVESTPVAAAAATPAASGNCKAARQRIPLLYKNLIASQKDVTIEHYHEDASNADDVVLVPNAEAVDDTPAVEEVPPTAQPLGSSKKARNRSTSTGDSVYAKGKSSKRGQEQQQKTTVVASSDSEVDEGVSQSVEKPPSTTKAAKSSTTTVTKPAKTAKKRKSITEDSPPSEPETPSVPYIHSGEAVANAQASPKRRDGKKRQRLSTLTKTPESDNAFMSMISTIAQGGDVSDSDSVEMLPSTIEEVTICSSDEQNKAPMDTMSRQNKGSVFFPHEDVLKLVPIERKRDEWFISDADKIGPLPVARIRCLNCHQMGHIRSKCKEPYKPPVCYMCGETGHLEPRCRKTICLMCGNNTRTYQIRCQQCQNMNNTRCTNCRAVGHAAFVCPEFWRRYHDTIEDVIKLTPLTGTLIRRPKYCSVCGRRGHFADDCRLSGAFLDFRVAPMSIIKYHTIYPDSRWNPRVEVRPPSRNREEEQEVEIEVGARKRKKENKRKRSSNGESRWDQCASEGTASTVVDQPPENAPRDVPPVPIQEDPPTTEQEPEKVPVAFKITFDCQSDERQVTSTTKSNEATGVDAPPAPPKPSTVRKMSPNSDSNYSFSDFFEKERQMNSLIGQEQALNPSPVDPSPIEPPSEQNVTESSAVTAAEEFISINSASSTTTGDSNAMTVSSSNLQLVQQQPEAEMSSDKESEARIYLTKAHSKVLINDRGSEFLRIMSEKFNIRVRLEWQSVGNLLTVCGLERGQNAFHHELTAFLERLDTDKAQHINTLPVRKDRLIVALTMSISRLRENLGNVYELLQKQGKKPHGLKSRKDADRARRQLNMILFGQAGLRDGKRRLDELKRGLWQLRKDPGSEINVQWRLEMEEHFKYIFTPFSHDNYPDLVHRYNAWRKFNQRCGPSGRPPAGNVNQGAPQPPPQQMD